jgi:tetratricopeptide (TPR) repeat protein
VTFRAGAVRFTALLIAVALCGAASAPKAKTDPFLERDFAAFQKAFHAANFSTALTLAKTGGADARQRKNAHYVAVFARCEGAAQEYLGNDAAAIASYTAALKADSDRGKAYDLAGIGRVEEDLDRYADAITALKRALALDRRLKDKVRESLDLAALGSVYEDLHRYKDSLSTELQVVALDRARGDRKREADALPNVGLAYQDLGRYSEALAAYARMLDLERRLGRTSGQARALGGTGDVYDKLRRYTDALQSYESALALDVASGDRRGEAYDRSSIGNVEEELARYTDALASENQSLAIYRSLNDRGGESEQYGLIGIVLEDQGLYSEALASQQNALAIDRDLSNRDGQETDLSNIGNLYLELGEYDAALQAHEEALAIDRALGNLSDEALDLGNIAGLYEALGRYPDALALDRQALSMSAKAGDRVATGQHLADEGVILGLLGRFTEALSAQLQALAIYRALDYTTGEEQDLGNIADDYVRQGRYSDALPYSLQAVALARKLDYRFGEASTLGDLGVIYFDLGRYADARATHLQALALDQSLGLPNIWKSLNGLAIDEVKLGMQNDALAHFDAAIDKIEALRGSLANETDRRTFFATTTDIYQYYIEYLLDLNRRFPKAQYDRKALQIFEREQARAFLEEIGKSSARRFSDIPPEVVAQEAQLTDAVEHDATNLITVRSAKSVDAATVGELEKHQAGLMQQQSTLEATIRAKYPEYYALTHPQPIDPAALQQLLGPGELMLVYDVLDKTTALWVVGRSELRVYSVPLGASDVTKRVADFRKSEVAMQSAIDQKTPAIGLVRVAAEQQPGFERASNALYDALLPAEMRTDLSKATNLFIVPTGPLYGLPWEALVMQAGTAGSLPHFLLEDHAVSYLSSASLLGVLRDAETHRVRARRDPLVAFADPNFGPSKHPAAADPAASEQLRSRSLAEVVSRGVPGASGFPALPGTAQEVEAVETTLGVPASSHPLYEKDAASRASVLQLDAADCSKGPCLKDYRYVIFATHAVLPDQVSGVLQPALVLSHPNDDGFLTMGDVFGLSLDADLVSLSACNTGGGTATHGEGVRGLTQAFMYAGTPAVTVTLWDIADAAGQELTPAFYAGLKSGKSPAEALRQAKLQMLNGGNPLFADPFFWAPTVLFGDGTGPQR